MGLKKTRTIELTDEEIIHTMVMLKLEGFREKRDFPKAVRGNRPSGQRIIGRVLKKLRKSLETP